MIANSVVPDEKIKVLIADDNDTDRLILESIVKKQGHEVVTAADGLEAVDVFKAERPQVVLLDALMPRMDGMGAARYIKELAGEELVPVLFLTSLKDAQSLAGCLDAGGDDFLTKPYNRIILQAKINAFNRMRKMHAMMQAQRDQIELNNEHLLHEQEVAKSVFDNVAHAGCIDAPNIKHLLSPLAIFNGDVLLASVKPSGGMHVLLGDFTGHGLPAAIGAMPLAEIFYGMTSKGFTIGDILCEINQKLKSILPVGVFCCACMVDLSFEKQLIGVWMGGLPDCILYHQKTGTYEMIPSSHLPLGVLGANSFKADITTMAMPKGDRLYIWSDGILEASNADGKMFGEEGVVSVFDDNEDVEYMFDDIQSAVANFIGESERDDDITVVEVKMVDGAELKDMVVSMQSASLSGPMSWSMSYEARADTLREFNPLPLMLQIIVEVPGLRPRSGQIYTMLSELYSNALEHGVLGLASSIKATPTGFLNYYSRRGELLQQLQTGFVRFEFTHTPVPGGGELLLRIEDSGPGFDHAAERDNEHKTQGYCGRGIPLIRALCKEFNYMGKGNKVEALYCWQHE